MVISIGSVEIFKMGKEMKLYISFAAFAALLAGCVTEPEYPIVEGSETCPAIQPGTGAEFKAAEALLNDETGNFSIIKCWYVTNDGKELSGIEAGGPYQLDYPQLWLESDIDSWICTESSQACAYREL